jgi:hypothetical protein
VRANQPPRIIREMQGCNDLIDEIRLPDELVPWSHGGYFNERSEIERLRGKRRLVTSTSSRGMVLSITQLQFVSNDAVVVHDDVSFRYIDDLSDLQVTQENINPLGPFVV